MLQNKLLRNESQRVCKLYQTKKYIHLTFKVVMDTDKQYNNATYTWFKKCCNVLIVSIYVFVTFTIPMYLLIENHNYTKATAITDCY